MTTRDFDKTWEIEGRTFTPTDVAAEILTAIREEAEKKYDPDGKITAVITVPAYFRTGLVSVPFPQYQENSCKGKIYCP